MALDLLFSLHHSLCLVHFTTCTMNSYFAESLSLNAGVPAISGRDAGLLYNSQAAHLANQSRRAHAIDLMGLGRAARRLSYRVEL
ncbi:hypothetical protein PGT21_005903 [Puccinia graminis f. sp. tritici]|uniref:Uncharacterized protein n=1 Tax=Puccinia graminis f. sp. tritici TaxID=56615 RepID=A0A5B0MT86_PUCGR|nr:hypothetical protein PGT21_005903 [Puccinia graminis f. sp. tritici]